MLKFDNCQIVKRNRCNMNMSSNNYGNRCIYLLQLNNMYISNGRTNGDLSGKPTCKGISCVDYFICNANVFKCIDSCDVLYYCPLYSDAHNAVCLTLNFLGESTPEERFFGEPLIKLWDNSKSS